MKKISELLKADLLDILRRPANMVFAITMIFGILILTGYVLKSGTTGDIIASYSVFISAYTGFIMTSMGVMTDRDKGFYRMYRSSKLSKAEYVTSKLAYTSLSLLLSVIVIAIGFLTNDISLSLMAAPVLLISTLAHAGMGLVIPAFVDTTPEGQRITQVIFFAMLFISPVFYTTEGLPQIIKIVQQFIPLTHSIEVMRAIMLNEGSLGSLWRHISILTGLTVATFSIGYRKLEF